MINKTQGQMRNPDSLNAHIRQGAVFAMVCLGALGACWFVASAEESGLLIELASWLTPMADDPGLAYGILPLLGGLILFSAITSQVRHAGNLLQKRFQTMGVLAGRTQAEIEAVVGAPNGISALPEGKTLCQWSAPGYHIGLIFADGQCEGLSSEFAS